MAALPMFVFAIWLGWPQPAPTLADLEFAMAVEESVMAEPGTIAPEPFRGLIERQGSDCYRCREIASRKLKAASWLNSQWLYWGRKHRDPEVRLRSNAILRRINPCPSCGGSGASRHYREDPCWDCQGLGSVWPWSAWD
ncbi:MAG: hypothetical protein ACLQGP_08075 [Isosphaeraceae bacterium]